MPQEKTIPFNDAELELLSRYLHQELGIVVQDNHSSLVYTHLKRRVNQLGYSSFNNYYHHELIPKVDERQHLINLVTNNKTQFFREQIQLEYIQETLFAEISEHAAKDRKIRIWCAACSTGEEPYTLAMLLHESFGPEWDIKILASDVNTHVLQHAAKGIYSAESISTIDSELRKEYFSTASSLEGHYQVSPKLRSMVQFRQINLTDEDYSLIKTKFDLILCRNVTIYFSKEIIQALLTRLHQLLKQEGHLAIGVAEALELSEQQFKKRRFNIFSPVSTQQQIERENPVIVIGGSTGGVNAVESVIAPLPADTPGIIVAIHISNQYSGSLAKRLDRQVAMKVREAKSGDLIRRGIVLVAPGDRHITLERRDDGQLQVSLHQHQPGDSFIPSVDRLFSSTSQAAGSLSIGVLLTGMGSDGARGMRDMRRENARTITQNRESCVVYGMPKAAEALNASELSCHLKKIPDALQYAIPLVGEEGHSRRLRHWKNTNFIKLNHSTSDALQHRK